MFILLSQLRFFLEVLSLYIFKWHVHRNAKRCGLFPVFAHNLSCISFLCFCLYLKQQ